jgi:hypothetical protein
LILGLVPSPTRSCAPTFTSFVPKILSKGNKEGKRKKKTLSCFLPLAISRVSSDRKDAISDDTELRSPLPRPMLASLLRPIHLPYHFIWYSHSLSFSVCASIADLFLEIQSSSIKFRDGDILLYFQAMRSISLDMYQIFPLRGLDML